MSTEVKAVPNVPPALRTLVTEAVGAASVCWKEVEDERIFDTEQALKVADDLVTHIEQAFDAREQPLFAHLASVSHNLQQLAGAEALTMSDEDDHVKFAAQQFLTEARDRLVSVIALLEQPR